MEPNDGIKGGSGGIIRRRLYKPLAVLAVLALSTMMCLSLGGTPSDETGSGPDVAATLAALQTELANAQATVEAAGNTQPPTLAPSDSTEPTEPPAAAAPGQKVEDTFDSDLGTFALGEGIQIQNGSLLLGPFEQCAEDVAAFDSPINCNAVCLTCGANLTNYRMQADISFADGLSDKQWGIILRFVDENGNGLLDREDYLMVIGFDVFDNAWAIFVHVPNAVSLVSCKVRGGRIARPKQPEPLRGHRLQQRPDDRRPVERQTPGPVDRRCAPTGRDTDQGLGR